LIGVLDALRVVVVVPIDAVDVLGALTGVIDVVRISD
jgi:hypothetical protein